MRSARMRRISASGAICATAGSARKRRRVRPACVLLFRPSGGLNMRKNIALMSVALAVIVLGGCGRDETAEAPASTTTVEQAGTTNPSDVAPITAQTWIDDVTIGHELAADGSMATGKGGDDFAPGQPIYVAMEV